MTGMKKLYPIAESEQRHVYHGIKAVKTGEFRRPKTGEWFLSGAVPQAYRCYYGPAMNCAYYIVTLVPERQQ